MGGFYNRGLKEIMDGTIDLLADTIIVIGVSSSYTFNADHDFVDPGTNDAADVSFNELTNTGYARKTLASKTITANDTDDKAYFDAADISYTALAAGTGLDALVVAKNSGADGTSVLIAYIDAGTNIPFTPNGSNFTVTWPTSGIWALRTF